MKFCITRNLLSSLLLFAVSAQPVASEAVPARRQLADKCSVVIVATVLRIDPFLYTEQIERVTPLTVSVNPPGAPSFTLRVFCVGQAISSNCSQLLERDRIQLTGEMRQLLLINPAGGDADIERHFPGVAVNRLTLQSRVGG